MNDCCQMVRRFGLVPEFRAHLRQGREQEGVLASISEDDLCALENGQLCVESLQNKDASGGKVTES